MLSTFVRLTAMSAAAVTLTACGGSGPHDVVASSTGGEAALSALSAASQDLCAAAGKDVSLVGDSSVTFVRGATTTTSDANTWLAERHKDGGPSVSLDNYSRLDSKAGADAPFTVCLFKTSVPRPIPTRPGAKTVANGTRIFAQAPDRFVVDAIGDVDRLAADFDSLKSTSESSPK